VSRTARSYRIVVEYITLNEQGARTVTHLHVCTSMADLAVLLHTLDESAAVASMSVFSTLALPALHTFGKLTGEDLGIVDLKKLS
jgi:hypothetical protein